MIDFITKYEFEELRKCYNNPAYFIEHYIKMDTPMHPNMHLNMYPYINGVISDIQNHQFTIGTVSRQIGITTLIGAYALWSCLFRIDQIVGIFANSTTRSVDILHKIYNMYHYLPEFLSIKTLSANKKMVVFNNGSKIICGSHTNQNFCRGLSLSMAIVDDCSYGDQTSIESFFQSMMPCLAPGSGKLIVTSTPDMSTDYFAKLWNGATDNGVGSVGSNGFKSFLLPWTSVPHRDKDWADHIKSIIGPDKWAREYECSFIP